MEKRELVIIESPWKAESTTERIRNKSYAIRCLNDSILRGEAPFASHLLYTQVIDETDDNARNEGIEMGLVWGYFAAKTVVYTDYGITPGMNTGILRANKEGRPVETRSIKIETIFDTIHGLLLTISEYYNINLNDLISASRKDERCIARMIYYKLARNMFPDMSYAKIGAKVNRDHSTVINGILTVGYKLHLTAEYKEFCSHYNLKFD